MKTMGQVSLDFIFIVLYVSELNKQYIHWQKQTTKPLLFILVFPLGIGGPNGRNGIIKKSNIFWPLKDAQVHIQGVSYYIIVTYELFV